MIPRLQLLDSKLDDIETNLKRIKVPQSSRIYRPAPPSVPAPLSARSHADSRLKQPTVFLKDFDSGDAQHEHLPQIGGGSARHQSRLAASYRHLKEEELKRRTEYLNKEKAREEEQRRLDALRLQQRETLGHAPLTQMDQKMKPSKIPAPCISTSPVLSPRRSAVPSRIPPVGKSLHLPPAAPSSSAAVAISNVSPSRKHATAKPYFVPPVDLEKKREQDQNALLKVYEERQQHFRQLSQDLAREMKMEEEQRLKTQNSNSGPSASSSSLTSSSSSSSDQQTSASASSSELKMAASVDASLACSVSVSSSSSSSAAAVPVESVTPSATVISDSAVVPPVQSDSSPSSSASFGVNTSSSSSEVVAASASSIDSSSESSSSSSQQSSEAASTSSSVDVSSSSVSTTAPAVSTADPSSDPETYTQMVFAAAASSSSVVGASPFSGDSGVPKPKAIEPLQADFGGGCMPSWIAKKEPEGTSMYVYGDESSAALQSQQSDTKAADVAASASAVDASSASASVSSSVTAADEEAARRIEKQAEEQAAQAQALLQESQKPGYDPSAAVVS